MFVDLCSSFVRDVSVDYELAVRREEVSLFVDYFDPGFINIFWKKGGIFKLQI